MKHIQTYILYENTISGSTYTNQQLSDKKNINQKNLDKAFHDAIIDGKYGLLKSLYEQGANINARYNFDYTPLLISSSFDRLKIVQDLISYGADMTLTEFKGRDFIHFAHGDVESWLNTKEGQKIIINKNPSMIHSFIKNKILLRPEIKEEFGHLISADELGLLDKMTHLNTFIEYKLFEHDELLSHELLTLSTRTSPTAYNRIRELLTLDVDVNVSNDRGETALMLAINHDCIENIKLLLKAGADVNRKDQYGRSALTDYFLFNKERDEIPALLIKYGADVNNQDANGDTLLHRAAWNSNIDLIKWLLDRGADATIVNDRNETFIQMSELNVLQWWKSNDNETIKLLNKFPTLYPIMYRMNALSDKVEEEYKHLKSAGDLNLL